uniref:Putative endonuclease-reverse transcriptase n=1 Tax=Rhipicephalus microplus TaxID=6941 RepID=A0A6G5ABF2_RHIMP
MLTSNNSRPSVPSSCEATDHGGGQICNAAEGAKNLWIRTGRHWNLNLATFNARTLSSEGSLAVLFEELEGVKWDIIGLSEVRRTDEAYTVLQNGHVLCYRGLADRRELGVGFLIHRNIAGNIEEYYSINERVVGIVIKLNKRYKMKVVQAYAPTSSHDDASVESFYEDVESAMSKVKTQYTILMEDFHAKVGKKQAGYQAVGDYGIGTRNL